MEQKAVGFIGYLIDRALIIIGLIFMLIGAYTVWDNYLIYQQSTEKSLLAFKPGQEAAAPLQILSEDAVAWVTLYDTPIDYPVMQGENNSTYLNLNPYGEYSLSGSIFLDSRNKRDFSDFYNIIYGHHVTGGYMFGSLDEYFNKEYFESHKEGELIVGDKTYALHIFALINVDATDELIFNTREAMRQPDPLAMHVKELAVYYEAPMSTHWVSLTTCQDASSTARIALMGYLQEKESR